MKNGIPNGLVLLNGYVKQLILGRTGGVEILLTKLHFTYIFSCLFSWEFIEKLRWNKYITLGIIKLKLPKFLTFISLHRRSFNQYSIRAIPLYLKKITPIPPQLVKGKEATLFLHFVLEYC